MTCALSPLALRLGRPLAALGLLVHAAFLAVSIAGTQIGLGILAAGVLLCALGGERPARTPLDLPMLALAGVFTLSGLVSPYGPADLGTLTLWRSLVGFWLVTQALARAPEPRRAALRALLCALSGLALAACVGIVQSRTGFDPVFALGLRAEPRVVPAPGVEGQYVALGFYISRLTFSHVTLFLLAAALGALLSGLAAGKARLWVLSCTLLGVTALVLTYARAAWLGFGVVVITLGAGVGLERWRAARAEANANADAKASAKASATAKGLATALLLAVLALLLPGVRARLLSAFDLGQNSDRLFLWSRALEIIRDHPLWGIGFGNYPRVCGAYYDRVDPSFFMRTYAHNVPLSVLAETGPLGLLAALWLGVATLRLLLRARSAGNPLAPAGLAALLGLCLVAQLHDVHVDSKAMLAFWFVIALATAPARARDPA